MRTVLTALLILCGALSCCGQELLKNPSFEEVGTEPDHAAGWERWGNWMNREDSWTPTRSGKALIGYHHWQIESGGDSGLWQDAPVQKGKRYTFSIYVTQDPAKDAKPVQRLELALEATIDGKQAVIVRKVIPGNEIATNPQWSRLSITGTAPSDKMRVLVRIAPSTEAPRGGAIKMDDASLKLATTP